MLQRRSATTDSVQVPIQNQNERRYDTLGSVKCSPGRKYSELGGSISRKGGSLGPTNTANRRPSITDALSSINMNKVVADKVVADKMVVDVQAVLQVQQRRRAGANPTNAIGIAAAPAPPVRVSEPRATTGSVAERQNAAASLSSRSLAGAVEAMSISSGSSDGSSEGSGTTIVSEGGFTDYLSDESEAEIQRQVEKKVVLHIQQSAEDFEFKLAKADLEGVGIEPPESWTNTNPGRGEPSSRRFATMGHIRPRQGGHSALAVAASSRA